MCRADLGECAHHPHPWNEPDHVDRSWHLRHAAFLSTSFRRLERAIRSTCACILLILVAVRPSRSVRIDFPEGSPSVNRTMEVTVRRLAWEGTMGPEVAGFAEFAVSEFWKQHLEGAHRPFQSYFVHHFPSLVVSADEAFCWSLSLDDVQADTTIRFEYSAAQKRSDHHPAHGFLRRLAEGEGALFHAQ